MKKRKDIVLVFLCAGMEICWLYALAAFSMTSAGGFFPVSVALIGFIAGACIMHFTSGRGWRIISLIAVQVLTFVTAISISIYITYFSSYPFFNKVRLVEFFTAVRSPFEWLNLILIIFFCVLFWISGSFFSKRTNTYYKLCARFDIGITAFFCLFLLKFILLVKGGIRIDDNSFSLLFPFFLFSLLAIGAVKTQNAQKNFLPGFRGVGIIMSIILIVILSAAIVLFLMPLLTRTAEISFNILKSGAGFIMPAVISILRFLFAPRSMQSEPAVGSPKDDTLHWISESSKWPEVLENIFKWGIKIIAVMMIVIIAGIVLYYLFRWLFKKTAVIRREIDKADKEVPWYVRLWAFFVSIFKVILRKLSGYHKAAELYRMLMAWGRRSGVAGSISETPLEYGTRLRLRFPRLKNDIDLIVNAFNSEVYGGINLPRGMIADARSAWSRLRSPRNWPARLKRIFFSGGSRYE
ncbi:MAG: DUF4129 domain-containing protein [Spirochaetes bacterium]|nr:DUF4129 domain-containing protein [Spirochaetota bacterium]